MATLPKMKIFRKGALEMAKSSNLPIAVGRLDRRFESYNLVGFVRTGALYKSIELTFSSRNRGHFTPPSRNQRVPGRGAGGRSTENLGP